MHDGRLDLAIIRLPKRRADLEAKFLLREPMVLVLPPGHRLGGKRAVSLSEVAQEPFVAMKDGYGLRELLRSVCQKAGFEPRIGVETSQLGSVVGLVLAGVGVTVLPEMAAGSEGRRVRIRDPYAYRDLGVIWRQGQPLAPAASAFLDMLRRSVDVDGREASHPLTAERERR